MYGLIVSITAVAGRRDQLIAILLESSGGLPGCLSYVVAKDAANPDVVWITEVWETTELHDASFTLPAVQATMARGRPLIASVGTPTITEPAGGYGLR